MRLADIIRADKLNVRVSDWKVGKVPKSAFPLSKNRGPISLGSGWEWRVIDFDALGHSFKVLIKLNSEKQYYSAILAWDKDGDSAIICHHELHMSHRGWHCHLVKGDINVVLPGVWRDRSRMVCWPDGGQPPESFDVSKASALTKAAACYRFQAQGDLL